MVVIPPRLHPHRAAVAAVAATATATANDTDADADAAVGSPSLRRAWRSAASHHGRRNDGDDDDDDDRAPTAVTTTTAATTTPAVHDDGNFGRSCRRATSRVTSHPAARTLARGDVYTRASLFPHARLTLTARAERQRNVGGRGTDRRRGARRGWERRGVWREEIGKRHGRETRVVGAEGVGG